MVAFEWQPFLYLIFLVNIFAPYHSIELANPKQNATFMMLYQHKTAV